MKIKEILSYGKEKLNQSNIEDANLKCRLLLCSYLNCSKEYLMINESQEVSSEIFEHFSQDIQRLLQNTPIQYIIHYQSFYGLDFYVDENVLIPQPDTEILVEEAICIAKEMQKSQKTLKILDLCTGSGAIVTSLGVNLSNCEMYASDISKKALAIAQKNTTQNGVKVTFLESDLLEKVNQTFDIIVSNPPYIETEVIQKLPEEVQQEPHIALDGGEDGLVFYRKIAKEAKNYLVPNGILALEIGFNQKDEVIKILAENDYQEIYSKKDFAGNDRIVVGKRGE